MRNKFHFLLTKLSIFLLIPFTLSSCYFIGILLSEHPKTEADEIGEILEHENNIWWPHYNCSHFAIEIWNIVSDKKIEANFIQTPSDLKK